MKDFVMSQEVLDIINGTFKNYAIDLYQDTVFPKAVGTKLCLGYEDDFFLGDYCDCGGRYERHINVCVVMIEHKGVMTPALLITITEERYGYSCDGDLIDSEIEDAFYLLEDGTDIDIEEE